MRFQFSGHARPNRGSGYRSFSNRGPRLPKAFDPRDIINQPHDVRVVPVAEVTHEFPDFGLSKLLLDNLKNKGYLKPTPIQDQAIPHIMSGRDLIGMANTGTGKTAAFLLPLIEKILKNRRERVLIVSPTRELAAQIQAEFYSFSQGLKILSVLCIGGVSIAPQKYNLRRNPNFVIGTPGRIRDLIGEEHLNLSTFHTVVIDEADHMVDVGFLPDAKFIISLLPKDRQSLFFSATIGPKENDIMRSFVINAVTVSVKTRETVDNIHQKTVKVDSGSKKIDQLHNLLIGQGYEKVIIFGRTKWGVQKLSEDLVKRGFKADAIHGDKTQAQRQRTLERFKRDEIKILLATDVASRGLDIPNVSHVINYDLPQTKDDYIHRIGRTGRADKKGVAISFV